MLHVHQFPCLTDNYGFLLHDLVSGETACIDTPDGAEYLKQARTKGWTITQIWNTHWHPDHTQGNGAIKEATGAPITAPREVEKVSDIDRVIAHGDQVSLGEWRGDVFDASGHTDGHVAFHLPQARIAFVGDCVFALGCGRMFEGEPKQFWASLDRVRQLPPDTTLYCAHEYTAANAKFAVHADPGNAALEAYTEEIIMKREAGEWTVPTVLERELETNPFLRADHPTIMEKWGGSAPHETFAALRMAKDSF
ncbi:MAG: hydroxyacylglutathione hydrolase [Pseudomonadota bacterium]